MRCGSADQDCVSSEPPKSTARRMMGPYRSTAGQAGNSRTGVTASACVRETVCDGLADGFRPIAVKEAIGDRIPGAVLWNLFDIDAKFGDVETVETCLQQLDRIGKELREPVTA